MDLIRLGLLGASGRMGLRVQDELRRAEFVSVFSLVAAPLRGDDLAPLLNCDVVLDFSSPSGALEALARVAPARPDMAWVVGSTGWTEAESRKLADWGRSAVILKASNFSVGVLALGEILAQAKSLPLLADFSVRIRESHHAHKKDAPSGTALTLRERLSPDVPIESVREGDVIGFHEVIFEGVGETLRLSHDAQDRALFARGALKSAARLVEKRATLSAGILSMRELWMGV